jgi:hypothetical protein
MSCGYFPGRLVGPVKASAQAFTFPAISVPQWARSGAIFEGDPCALNAPQLPAFGEQRSDESRKPSDLAAENPREHLGLALIRAIVNEDAGATLGLSCPEIAFPFSHPNEAQTVEIDIAVTTMPDVPEQDRLAEAVVRGLGEGAGTRNSAAAIVEPVSGDVPGGYLGHQDLRSAMNDDKTLTAVTPTASMISIGLPWGNGICKRPRPIPAMWQTGCVPTNRGRLSWRGSCPVN